MLGKVTGNNEMKIELAVWVGQSMPTYQPYQVWEVVVDMDELFCFLFQLSHGGWWLSPASPLSLLGLVSQYIRADADSSICKHS